MARKRIIRTKQHTTEMDLYVALLKSEERKLLNQLGPIQIKLQIAMIAQSNGANVDSIAEKLNTTTEKIGEFFALDSDPELRETANMASALGRRLHPEYHDIKRPLKFEAGV